MRWISRACKYANKATYKYTMHYRLLSECNMLAIGLVAWNKHDDDDDDDDDDNDDDATIKMRGRFAITSVSRETCWSSPLNVASNRASRLPR